MAFKLINITGKCSKCKLGYGFQENGLCEAKCGADEFLKEENSSECGSCIDFNKDQNCLSCLDLSGVCSVCKEGLHLNENKFCRVKCEAGQYWKGRDDNTCGACLESTSDENCVSCLDLTGKCSVCKDGFILDVKWSAETDSLM